MKEWPSSARIAWFGASFLLILIVLAPLWWLCIPAYGWLLVQGCGSALKYGMGVPVLAGRIEVQGILNTGSVLIFYLDGHEPTMKIAQLVTNLPPFWALVLATPGLGWKRRLGGLAGGSALLVLLHAAYIVGMVRFGPMIQPSEVPVAGELPAAISQFLLTLPFLLWIVLAYWWRGNQGTKGT